jgi:hypothetical protein
VSVLNDGEGDAAGGVNVGGVLAQGRLEASFRLGKPPRAQGRLAFDPVPIVLRPGLCRGARQQAYPQNAAEHE